MIQKIKDAKIVITHGGPSSFILPLQYGKTPIVVPRVKKYDEHVNDHQVEFCRKYNSLNKNITVVVDIDELNSELFSIVKEKKLVDSNSNTLNFCKNLSKILEEVLS